MQRYPHLESNHQKQKTKRILKSAREKQIITYKGASIRLATDFSSETTQARRKWDGIFKALKQKDGQPRILYLAKLIFKS